VRIRQFIAINTKFIAAEAEKALTITREVLETFIKDISLAHSAMQMKFSYVKSKEYGSFGTVTSQLRSVDHTRIDVTRTLSPSDFDSLRPTTNTTFRDKLTTLESFQVVVSKLSDHVGKLGQQASKRASGMLSHQILRAKRRRLQKRDLT
jgi:hypothetical protein